MGKKRRVVYSYFKWMEESCHSQYWQMFKTHHRLAEKAGGMGLGTQYIPRTPPQPE